MSTSSDTEDEFWGGDAIPQIAQDAVIPLRNRGKAPHIERGTSTAPQRTEGRFHSSTHSVGQRREEHYDKANNSSLSARAKGKQSPAPSIPNAPPVRRIDSSGYSADSGSDDDYSIVEELLNAESDSDPALSKGGSFAFSDLKSHNSSMTSLASSSSYNVATGRKRALPYEDTWTTPIVPVPPSSKQPKLSKGTLRADSGTPSRSSASSTTRLRHIEDGVASAPTTPHRPNRIAQPESPTPYRDRIETPIMSRVVNQLAHSMGLEDVGEMEGVCIIAHSKVAQALMDSMDIAWGVQYEIARGVSKCWWTWSDVTPERLEKLRGLNKDAALKVPLVLPHSSSTGIYQPELQVWAELDREEKAICEDRHRGLGLQGEWMEAEDWYGGKVQQVALLEEGGNSLHLVLGSMETRKSCRFARFLGSRRLIQVSVSREMLRTHGDTLKDFFKQKFILCGRVFVAFGMKEGKIFLMETQEDYERGSRILSDARRMSLEEFVNWHNPLDKNGNQAVSKWTTRFDLGLSISVPALAFAPDNMFNIDDDCVNKNPGKAKTEEIYTDGCGYMNGAALSAIGRRMGYCVRPTAVQGRIAGVKGLWVLHLRDRSPDAVPKIWIRSSQTKIKLDLNNLHRAHLIFDLVAPPRVMLPSRLSRLTILNLSHNGVPTRTFVDLMEETLNEQVRSLTRWTHPQDMQLLWATVNRIGHVSASRVQQYALGASRALGLSGRIKEGIYPTDEPVDLLKELLYGELDEEEGTTLLTELETAGAVPQRLRNKFTGEPLTIHGVVMDLLQAGFHPLKLPFLYDKLKKITTDVIEDVIRDFHVTVPLSAEAFIVPDPFGVLKPGQIYFKSSENLKPALEDLHPNIVLGEVLIYRNPNRLPSDVQKVTAIAHEALSDYTDVIVLPTQGPCSFASMLAGGDYDGDVCVCIYDPRLVQGFKNAPLAQQPENFLKDNFEDQGTIEQVAAVAMQMNQMVNDPDARRKKLQDALLSDISQPLIGAYSVFHENAAYVHGYDAPETVRNAFMFNTILDSRKSGLKVKNDVYRRDKQRYDRGRPICLQAGGKSAEGDLPSSVVSLSRPPVLGRFILDELLQEGERMRDFHLHRYDQFIQNTQYSARSDQELLRPYTTASALPDLPQVKSDLTRIRTHVEEHITKWQKTARASKSTPRTPSRRGKTRGGRSAPVESRNKWRELKKSFATGPDIASDSLLATLGDLEALKASCAYALNPKFAWSVAFQALCRIKATSQGSIALTGTFADSMSISSSAVRVFEQSRLGMS